MKKILMIIGGFVVGIIILGVIVFSAISATSKKWYANLMRETLQ